jgi:2-polyprenyl-3-methyl-5-hydroxy-6-metoxy-1,4-benzoquinol methylase
MVNSCHYLSVIRFDNYKLKTNETSNLYLCLWSQIVVMQWTIGWWQISVQRIWPTEEKLRQLYDTAAPNWQEILQRLGYDRAYLKLFRSLQKSGVLAHLNSHSQVCDCGIGSAAFSLSLLKILTPKLKVIGVDISEQMLSTASRLLDRAGINYQLCQHDIRALPFGDNSFDVVLAAHVLEHLPNPNAGLQEMVRVLRPEAPLILAVTRSGLFGAWIQWHWGNSCLNSKALTKMAIDAGLTNIRFYSFNSGLSRCTSFVCVGYKKS